jgi:hypothetical protein
LVRFLCMVFPFFGFRVDSDRFPVRLHPDAQLGIRTLGTPQSDPRRNAFMKPKTYQTQA